MNKPFPRKVSVAGTVAVTCLLRATKMEQFVVWWPDLGFRMTSLVADHFLRRWSQKLFWRIILGSEPQSTCSSFLPSQKAQLREALTQLGLDWGTAAKLDLEGLREHYATDAVSSAALTRIISAYVAALDDPSKLPALSEAIRSAPQQLANVIPNATRISEQKQDLNNRILQTRSLVK